MDLKVIYDINEAFNITDNKSKFNQVIYIYITLQW